MYDVVIIGAGIGGLVCGCYLARGGLKVLLVEQHYRPGGYCASFARKQFIFDAAAHAFGSYRAGGVLREIICELGLDKKLVVQKYDPTDIILTPHGTVRFWGDVSRTVSELCEMFPHEAPGINAFFSFLRNAQPFDLAALRHATFEDLLNRFVGDEKLRSLLSFPIFGISGLPPARIAAFAGVTLYNEYYLDGGYHPKNSMQALPDLLASQFKAFGGELRLSCAASSIRVNGQNETCGVVLSDAEFIASKNVVSACDAHHTFLNLLPTEIAGKQLVQKLEAATPSLSYFIAYLGIEQSGIDLLQPGVSVWIMSDYDIVGMQERSIRSEAVTPATPFLVHTRPDGKSVQAFVFAPFRTEDYWRRNKSRFLSNFIRRIESAFPGISDHIVYREAASPWTLHRYTLNYKGAAYGWAATPEQLFTPEFTGISSIKNLHLASHWTAQSQGISGVAYIGKETAMRILRKKKKC